MLSKQTMAAIIVASVLLLTAGVRHGVKKVGHKIGCVAKHGKRCAKTPKK